MPTTGATWQLSCPRQLYHAVTPPHGCCCGTWQQTCVLDQCTAHSPNQWLQHLHLAQGLLLTYWPPCVLVPGLHCGWPHLCCCALLQLGWSTPGAPVAAQAAVQSELKWCVVFADGMLLLIALAYDHWLWYVRCAWRLRVCLVCNAVALIQLHCPRRVCCANPSFVAVCMAQKKGENLQHALCWIHICPHLRITVTRACCAPPGLWNFVLCI